MRFPEDSGSPTLEECQAHVHSVPTSPFPVRALLSPSLSGPMQSFVENAMGSLRCWGLCLCGTGFSGSVGAVPAQTAGCSQGWAGLSL